MKFHETPLRGAYIIELDAIADERGYFARSYCAQAFRNAGIDMPVVQCNVSYNEKQGTLRGMHFHVEPKGEAKLVRCTRGSIYDVIVDLRPDSPTFKQWFGLELTESNLKSLYIPVGLAHGFITLADRTEVFYQMGEFYSAEHASGVRWNDPAFGIDWPIDVAVISPKDQAYPDFGP